MSVIINDFEVAPEPAAENTQAEGESPAAAAAAIAPQDILELMRHHAERMARVRAS